MFTSYCQIKKKTPINVCFQALKTIVSDLNPKTIRVDFEKGAMNAKTSEFPEAKLKGCFFHLSQCIWRQIQAAGQVSKKKNI